ncbi:MAG: AAA family ATPase [Deltaproteobacteria bacterium]|nr:AAA family ATPase [Deltaproteobacteria bacterium]
MEVLQAALENALAGHGRVVLLAGESGIGKTRLTGEFAAFAGRRGARVLLGRCYEGEGAPLLWPWIQIVRAYVADCDPRLLREELGPGAAVIARVIPEVQERLPELSVSPEVEVTQARFRFFDSIVRFLKAASVKQGQVLILDDLHWADTSSLLLLQFITREIGEAHILVLATYGDMELGRQRPLVQTVGEMVREPYTQSLHLERLNEAGRTRLGW